jgi:hypothetical protein
MKKRPRRKPSKPPPARHRTAPKEQTVLQYKVVELSTVDEATLEETLNAWVPKGWTVESVHFAMRESSKRPAMAFVFFTRAEKEAATDAETDRPRFQAVAEGASSLAGNVGAWERLARLASSGEPDP